MTENQLRDIISLWENIPLLIQYISENPENIDLILSIAHDDSFVRNWRALWLIDKIHEKHPELVIPYWPKLISFLFQTNDPSKKRHLLKLIGLHDIPEENMALLLNFCTDIFTSSTEPVAVRVHAMQILFRIALKEPDYAGELIELIKHEIEFHGSAGISSRGKKLLHKLHQIR
ncbi:MAG: hypothetical protein WAO52_00850 [Prolixibacteraceae bacterium]